MSTKQFRENARVNFVFQQGYSSLPVSQCLLKHPALMFQPRVLFIFFIGLIILNMRTGFFYTALLLAFCAAFPTLNPFEAIYRLVAPKKSKYLTPALPPRRFAQFLASLLCLVAYFAHVYSMEVLSWTTIFILLGAVSLQVIGNFCFGSVIYYFITGKIHFVLSTLPWVKRDKNSSDLYNSP